jgi:hypothetical protein
MCLRLLALLFVLVFSLASPAQTSERAKADSVPDTCPVTKPSDKPFVPPYPYPPRPYPGGSWFGTDRLWTVAPVAWRGLGHYTPDDPTFRQKMQWWRQGYDYRTEPIPKLKVTGRRLDAPAAPLMAEASNVAGALPSMMVGINLPALGCWEITGHYENDELTLVVWVAK